MKLERLISLLLNNTTQLTNDLRNTYNHQLVWRLPFYLNTFIQISYHSAQKEKCNIYSQAHKSQRRYVIYC